MSSNTESTVHTTLIYSHVHHVYRKYSLIFFPIFYDSQQKKVKYLT